MNKNYLYLLQLTLFLCLFGACVQAPQYPIEPEISFVSISKDTMIQGQTKNDDFLYLTLAFTDGDGDNFAGRVKDFRYYDEQLTESELIELTS